MKGGTATGPSPVDRGKTGSKHHVIVDAHGIPLATITTGGNRNDVTQLIPLIEAVPPIRGKRGQPLRRPKHLYADRGYDHETYRDQVRRFEITPHIARRGIEHGSGLGVYRWVVEGTSALLHWFRRLRIRWECRMHAAARQLQQDVGVAKGGGADRRRWPSFDDLWPTGNTVAASRGARLRDLMAGVGPTASGRR
jgi:transposase